MRTDKLTITQYVERAENHYDNASNIEPHFATAEALSSIAASLLVLIQQVSDLTAAVEEYVVKDRMR